MDYDPKTSLRQWPLQSMERFGKNSFGDPLYRIIFAPTRRNLVYGEWPDGSRKASWVKTYAHIGDCWVLERWLSPYQFAQMTEQQWNQTMLMLGPYPSRGEYEVAHVFESVPPHDANLDKLISWIEAGQGRSFWENRVACQAAADEDEKARSAQVRGLIQESLPAFGSEPLIGYGGGRGTKTRPILKTAEEAGLPTRPGFTKLPGTRKVPVTIDTDRGSAQIR